MAEVLGDSLAVNAPKKVVFTGNRFFPVIYRPGLSDDVVVVTPSTPTPAQGRLTQSQPDRASSPGWLVGRALGDLIGFPLGLEAAGGALYGALLTERSYARGIVGGAIGRVVAGFVQAHLNGHVREISGYNPTIVAVGDVMTNALAVGATSVAAGGSFRDGVLLGAVVEAAYAVMRRFLWIANI